MAKNQTERCPGCGDPLPEKVLCSISHTIAPGKSLCSDCGKKETFDLLWAEGHRIGWERHKAASASMAKAQRLLEGGK